jgi:hypothetical protein
VRRFLFRRQRQDPGEQLPASAIAAAAQDEDEPAASPELVGRLRELDWPTPPSEVRDRVLERVLAEAGGNGHSPRQNGK